MNTDQNYYNNPNVPEEKRRDVAFQTVNAVRESVTLAKNTSSSITYEHAFGIIHDLDPILYEAIVKLLTSKNENELVKYFKEAADALSIDETILPIDLIDEELSKVEDLISKATGTSLYLQKRKLGLYAAKEYFTPRNLSEHKSLNHDFYLKSRYEYFDKPLYDGDEYKDFKIGKNKVLRLRLLHPDNDETILGVDLVYEHFDLIINSVRIAHMQYKSWNDNVLYASQASNLIPQLNKMKANLCEQGMCKGPETIDRDYRFPYCCAFLRPTSKLQNSDSPLASNGAHLPICEAIKVLDATGKVTKNDLKDKSIKGHIFEELFISNLTGSRWINIDALDEFYTQRGILSHLNTIRVHAQEIDFQYDDDRQSSGQPTNL